MSLIAPTKQEQIDILKELIAEKNNELEELINRLIKLQERD